MKVLLEGFHPVKHALRFGAVVEGLVVVDLDAAVGLARSHAPELVDVLRERARVVDAREFVGIVGRSNNTGVAGWVERPVDRGIVERSSPVVLLDNPRNLGNFGAVIRVAAGLGAGGVFSLGDVDPWHPTVIRGSAGLHFALPVGRVDLADVVGAPGVGGGAGDGGGAGSVAEVGGPGAGGSDVGAGGPGVGGVAGVGRSGAGLGGTVIAFDAGGVDLRGVRISDDAVLAFGSERHGLSAAVRGRADLVVSLPMRDKVSSYNLTTSVAMGLYHWELFRRAS
ncbi:TrmH family RNA methyltransferase [Actinosynnema sp. NPDC020468]|uniref:TrmH family RNA methyltransferase n=1 Tax=Actinosynnema sp. NPDC020468 TaxID=3154488 RepID=UPI00340D6679